MDRVIEDDHLGLQLDHLAAFWVNVFRRKVVFRIDFNALQRQFIDLDAVARQIRTDVGRKRLRCCVCFLVSFSKNRKTDWSCGRCAEVRSPARAVRKTR